MDEENPDANKLKNPQVKIKAKDRPHYVNNADFLQHMKFHAKLVEVAKNTNQELPQVSDYIGGCILSIANKLSNRPNFMNYPFKEEMISDGIENCLMYLNNFNPEKSNNPFAYFTQIIYFAFIRRIQKEKKHLYTKYRLIEENFFGDHPDEVSAPTQYGSGHSEQYRQEFVTSFEKSRDEKKRINTRKKKEKINLESALEE
jgi:hypothetical protein